MLQEIKVCLSNVKSYGYTKGYSVYELVLICIDKINECVRYINESFTSFQTQINQKENSNDITNKRKLSKTGDFTGTIQGHASALLIAEVHDNTDDIAYLFEQFEDGQTGLNIDGGFFTDGTIADNFDGGTW